MKIFALASVVLFTLSCAVQPRGSFEAPASEVDYTDAANWAALPTKIDAADLLPGGDFTNRQAEAEVDVFYIYPTIYWSERSDRDWNAPLTPEMNARIDSSAIKNHATIFNGTGRVFAPYYRQAHIRAYREREDTTSARRAFELAYRDVERAFDHYLENYNRGRPFIIASHSQGTTHGMRLVRERIDGKALGKRMIAAYLVGIAIPPDYFSELPVCEDPDQTNCFVGWRTYREGATAEFSPNPGDAVVVNPLTWTTSETLAPRELNKGAVLRNFYGPATPNLVEARIAGSVLYTNKPKFPGSIFFTRKNYHIADFNFFWVDVRENAQRRAAKFLMK